LVLTAPTYNLEVSGSGYISGSLTVAGTITAQKLNVQQITSSVIYSSGSNIFGNDITNTQTLTGSLQVTGSTHYLLGDVGIGTTIPATILHLKDSGTTAITFEDSAGGTQTAKITYDQSGQNNLKISTQYQSSTDDNKIYFAPADSIAMTIRGGTGSSNGFVGIGTTNPTYKLHVDSNTDSLIRVSNGTETYLQSTYFGYDAGYDIIQIGDVYGKGNNGVSVALGIDPSIIAGGAFSGYEIALPDLTEFITANGPSGSATDWNQNVLVLSGSNVGIGTGTPSYKLDVAGSSRSDMLILRSNQSAPTADAFIFRPADNTVALGTANTERMRIDASGNVGIGQTGNAKLEVVATSGEVFRADSNNGAYRLVVNQTGANIQGTLDVLGQVDIKAGNDLRLYRSDNGTYARFNYAGGSVGLDIDDLNGDGINLQQAGVNKLRIETTGNATFAGDIDLAGNLTLGSAKLIKFGGNGARLYGDNVNKFVTIGTDSVERVRVIANGNVGIGKTNPTTKLDVTGSVLISGSLTVSGSSTFTNIGPAVFTGSITQNASTASFGGLVGIGTTSPGYMFDVLSTDGPTTARFANNDGEDTLVRIIAGNYNTELDARLFIGETDTYGMTFEYDGVANIGYIGMNDNVDPTGAYSKRIAMPRSTADTYFPAGNVGIGTTSTRG
jgi:hypothetical protein